MLRREKYYLPKVQNQLLECNLFAETSYVQWVGVFVLQINICPLK